MSEYWKSLPRKFCDICKCWFADNKASIDFHERGKRHQENAAKRIQDIQKRGQKEFKKQKQLEDDMAKIERAALAAYKKDLQNQSGTCLEKDVIEKLSNNIPEIPKSKPIIPPKKKKKNDKTHVKKINVSKATGKVWYEAMTDEGYKYYWNSENSESSWEPPEEGFVTLEEQNQAKETEVKQEIEENIESIPESTCAVGPQPKIDPYGQWVTIEQEESEEIDLQLPKPSEDIVEVVIPVVKDEPKLKIKEKVIGQLAGGDSGEEVTFKKRKFIGSSKRNTRQRILDDD